MIVKLMNSFPLFQLSLSDVCADESYEFEPCQDLGRGLGSRKTGLSPPVIITDRSKAVLLVRLMSV